MSENLSKLYQYEVCPFCWKARVGLALKNIAYEKVEVHPLNKKEISFSDSYKKVPIFIDSTGAQVNDSSEILKHIDSSSQMGASLFSKEGDESKRQKWLDWSEKFVKAIPPLIYQNRKDALKAFDYISKEGKFSWVQRKLVKYSGAFVMKMVADKSKKKQGIADVRAHFIDMMRQWSVGLENNDFMGGAEPDAADAAVYGFTMSLKGLPAQKLIDAVPDFKKWTERMDQKTKLSLN